MARVSGVQEMIAQPLYDAHVLEDDESFSDSMSDPRMLRFFIDVQNKTRLETNLQASGVLPSRNSFEARAMRVIIDPPTADDDNGAGFISMVVFNSVTTLLVGEKVMLEAPTFWLPSGSGVWSGDGTTAGHGVPDPMATFRFAEPVVIEPQQNFRVEMLFPDDVPGDLAEATGPARIWVALDGYYTRDVQ